MNYLFILLSLVLLSCTSSKNSVVPADHAPFLSRPSEFAVTRYEVIGSTLMITYSESDQAVEYVANYGINSANLTYQVACSNSKCIIPISGQNNYTVQVVAKNQAAAVATILYYIPDPNHQIVISSTVPTKNSFVSTWTTNNPEIISYSVWWGTASGVYSSNVQNATTPFTVPNLNTGVTYYYQIHGLDAFGNNYISNEVTLTTLGCDSNEYNNSGTCTPQVCTPMSNAACSANNGSGLKQCNSSGSGYASCVVSTCDSGYYMNSGTCSFQSCVPNAVVTCTENNGSGTKQCNALGSSYNSCSLTACSSGYYLSSGTCLTQTCSPSSVQSCGVSHATSNRTCNTLGSAYGSCSSPVCDSGFYMDNGNCTAQVCVPNASVTCGVSHATSTKTCNTVGSAYGTCSAPVCDSGYYMNNGTCTVQVCSPNTTTSCGIANGTSNKTCNTLGSSYGTCTALVCDAGFYNNNGTCSAQVCSPNATTSCGIANGTSNKTCDAQGSAYGSCSALVCDSGYYNNNGACSAQVCTPNATTSCSVANATSSKTCNALGSAYGTCSAPVCVDGYYNNTATSCQVFTVSANISVANQVTLTWTNIGSTSYTVTYDTVASGTMSQTQSCASSPCVISSLTGGTAYNFKVTGTNSFGTSKTATLTATPSMTPNWVQCAAQNGVCYFSGIRTIRFGVPGFYSTKNFTNAVNCTVRYFGDPKSGVTKTCDIDTNSRPTSSEATPVPQIISFSNPNSLNVPNTVQEFGYTTEATGLPFNWGHVSAVGSYIEYSIDVPQASNYSFNMLYATKEVNNSITVSINSVNKGVIPISVSADWSVYKWLATPLVIPLSSGLYRLRITVTNQKGLNIGGVTLDPVP